METHNKVEIQTELSRELGLVSCLAIGVGTMIAAGIFTLSGLAIRNVGSAAILSFLLAAIVATFTALTYCEFVSMYPESGEGYLYARKTFSPLVAYFVGWALFLGYTSSCAFYIASLSSYFNEFIWHSPIKNLSGVVALIALTLLNIKGTKESGSFQIFVTAGKVLLLIWFVAGGLGRIDPVEIMNKFSTDFLKIGSTAAMVFITFFGFSAIAATAGEVRNPVKTIPRAIFISMGIVTVLYTLVVLVVIAANLTEYSEAAMGTAARLFLGPIGGMVIISGALFSMISASNASIMAGSRVTLTMSQLGHLPEEIGVINERTRTPVVSTLLVGGAILLFTISLPLEDLAHFADTVLLLVLIIINYGLIIHRRKFPDIERPFKVPLVPLIPIMGIIANFYLLSQILTHPLPVLMASASLIFGVLGFVAWKGTRVEVEDLPWTPSRVAEGHYAMSESRYRILVPLANPANVASLIELAAPIAAEQQGEIVGLRVVVVPEQMPLAVNRGDVEREREILELADEHAQKHNVPLTSLVCVAHHAARAILDTARERRCNLIILGWKGYTTTAEKILGEICDTVVAHARSDIMLVRMNQDQPMTRFLLPTAGGEHARLAARLLAPIITDRKGSLTLCGIADPVITEEAINKISERLENEVNDIKGATDLNIDSTLIRHRSVTDGILAEAQNYDAIVVGASGHRFHSQILFGSITEMIAKNSQRPVIMVKHYHPVKALFGRVMRE